MPSCFCAQCELDSPALTLPTWRPWGDARPPAVERSGRHATAATMILCTCAAPGARVLVTQTRCTLTCVVDTLIPRQMIQLHVLALKC
jgi:hypothetical protein